MRADVTVRAATLDDIEGMRSIHADCDDPWAHPGSGPVWVNHRLLRGFLVDVATIGDAVVGHAEWLVSDEPAPFGRSFYLGLLQIHKDYQRRGIGRAMVEAGARKARSLQTLLLKTIPDQEAIGFYKQCGFTRLGTIHAVSIDVGSQELPKGWRRSHRVPAFVVANLPFRLGWSGQAASAFMWEHCNRPIRVAGDKVQHPCAKSDSGQAYVQLRSVDGTSALAVAWAGYEVALDELMEATLALAAASSLNRVTFSVIEPEGALLSTWAGQAASQAGEVWGRKL